MYTTHVGVFNASTSDTSLYHICRQAVVLFLELIITAHTSKVRALPSLAPQHVKAKLRQQRNFPTMDFLNSYIPPSPTRFTPKANGAKFEELPALRAPCDEKQVEKMKSGNYDEVRKLRSGLQKKTSQVQFIAPLSEDGESLQSVKLTPKVKPRPTEEGVRLPAPKIEKKRSEHRKRDKLNSNLFGFKFRRTPSQPDIDK